MKKGMSIIMLFIIFIVITSCASTVPKDGETINEEYLLKMSDKWREALEAPPDIVCAEVVESFFGPYSEEIKSDFHKIKEELNIRSSGEKKHHVVKSCYIIAKNTLFIQVFEVRER